MKPLRMAPRRSTVLRCAAPCCDAQAPRLAVRRLQAASEEAEAQRAWWGAAASAAAAHSGHPRLL